MDAMIRNTLALFLITCTAWGSAQQMHWSRLAEDTIYYAQEFLPEHIVVTSPGPGQIWDFRSLKAPYAVSRRIVVTGDRNTTTYAHVVNGKQHEAMLSLNGNSSEIIQVYENNPICPSRRLTFTLTPTKKPFFHNILGSSYTYEGKMQATFSWPRDILCKWRPPELPDSCRITYTISESIIVDAEGTLYMPTEVNSVYRQNVTERRYIRIETRRGNTWQDVTSKISGLPLITNREFMRFVSAHSGVMIAEAETKDDSRVIKVEFRTHPLITRIFSEEPTRPDVFAYPNPSFDVVRFRLSDLNYGRYKLKIFNILGVPVREMDVDVDDPRETVSLDLGELQRGTYLYRLQDASGRTIRTKRLVLIQL